MLTPVRGASGRARRCHPAVVTVGVRLHLRTESFRPCLGGTGFLVSAEPPREVRQYVEHGGKARRGLRARLRPGRLHGHRVLDRGESRCRASALGQGSCAAHEGMGCVGAQEGGEDVTGAKRLPDHGHRLVMPTGPGKTEGQNDPLLRLVDGVVDIRRVCAVITGVTEHVPRRCCGLAEFAGLECIGVDHLQRLPQARCHRFGSTRASRGGPRWPPAGR